MPNSDDWVEGFNTAYRQAVNFVKEEIEEGDPEKDPKLFLSWLVKGMEDDWENSA